MLDTGYGGYSELPQTPPGWPGLYYMAGGLVANMTGGVQLPYVAPNMGTYDAFLARANDRGYKQGLGSVYGQMGQMVAGMAGGMPFVQSLGGMAGYSPSQIRSDLANWSSGFGRSMVGQMIMPFVDQGLNALGVSGGSFVSAWDNVYSNRMNLLPSNERINPFDMLQQRTAVSGASAAMSLLQGAISRRDPKTGALTPMPEMAITQGFDRETVSGLAMKMAGFGAFTTGAGGFADRLQEAAGSIDIRHLNFANGDFTGGGDMSTLDQGSAAKVKQVARSFMSQVQAGLEAMGAMRDLLHEIDGVEEKLTTLTNGDWLRSGSGARAARDAVRKLHATAQMYNINPNAAVDQIMQNRGLLQAAAGFDETMQAFGFDGGGMFRLPAQTELLSNIEDMITARGFRGDPIMSGRLRMQGVQAFARNMNTQAGAAAQTLAWARQNGLVSEDQATEFQKGLMSGDQALMGSTINDIITQVFGSREYGQRMMQDQTVMNSIRQSLSDESGLFATRTIVAGADNEFVNRDRITAANNRRDFAQSLLSSAGMSVIPTGAAVGSMVDSAVNALNEYGGGEYAGAFRSSFDRMVAQGMSPEVALQATREAFKSNAATSQFTERIDLAVTKAQAASDEQTYLALGQAGTKAQAMLQAMYDTRTITGEQYSQGMGLIQKNMTDEALNLANGLYAGIDPSQRAFVKGAGDEAERAYLSGKAAIEDRRTAEEMLGVAAKGNFSSGAVAESASIIADAVRTYANGKMGETDKDELRAKLEKSRWRDIFGQDAYDSLVSELYLDGVLFSDEKDAVVGKFGRLASIMTQLAPQTLKATGYGLNMGGFFGAGRYAGNTAAINRERGQLQLDLANAVQESAVKDAGARQTIAQNFMDLLMDNKDWKQFLGVYGKGTGLGSAVSEWSTAMEDYEKAQGEYDSEHAGVIDEVAKMLRKQGKTKEAEGLIAMANNGGMSDDEIDEFVLKNLKGNATLSDGRNVSDATYEALQAARDVKDKRYEAMEAAKEVISDPNTVKALEQAKANKDSVDKRLQKSLSFMDDLDLSSGKITDRLDDLREALGDDVIAAKLGGKVTADDIDDLMDSDSGRARVYEATVSAGKAAALEGKNAKVSAAVEKLRVEANKGAMKIHGELIIKQGDEQATAACEASGIVNG